MAVVLVRGIGDVGSAVAHGLFSAGHAVVVHDRPCPAHPRRGMAFCDALFEGRAELEGVIAKTAREVSRIRLMVGCRKAVLASDIPFEELLREVHADVLVDARMRKRSLPEGQRGQARLVLGLGPNFRAGDNVDLAIETARGPRLGAVLDKGETASLSGEPSALAGHGRDRFIYASKGGVLRTDLNIGDRVERGAPIGRIGTLEFCAPFEGWLRGLAHDGASVEAGAKIAEIQAEAGLPLRGLGERPRQIAKGVLAAVSHSE